MAAEYQNVGKHNGGRSRIGMAHRWVLLMLTLVISAILVGGSCIFAFHLFDKGSTITQSADKLSTTEATHTKTSVNGGVTKVSVTAGQTQPPVITASPVPGSRPSPAAISSPNPTSTVIPVPSVTPGQSPTPTTMPSALSVSPGNIAMPYASCQIETHGGTPHYITCPVVLSNQSSAASTLSWSASMNPPDYTLSATSGTLAPGQSTTVYFSTYNGPICPANETLTFQGSFSTVQIPLTCSMIRTYPYQGAICTHNSDWTCNVTVTALAQNPTDVSWQVRAATMTGVTFSQTNGILAPGTSVVVTFTIASTDCPGSNLFVFVGGFFANAFNWQC